MPRRNGGRAQKGWFWQGNGFSRGKALPGKGSKGLSSRTKLHPVDLLALLRRKRPAPTVAATVAPTTAKGLLRPESATALLARPRRQRLLEHIWQRVSVSRAQFGLLYRGPFERYAALVQDFPASEAHHHAYPGGMVDHALESVAYVLRLRQSHLLPVGAPPETQAAQAEAWTACCSYAALLHDVGKIAVDLQVELDNGDCWHPWHGALRQQYRFRYRKDRTYRLHGAAAGLLYADILGSRILDWLTDFPELWAQLLYVLAGQYEHAGILGELVVQADQASVAQQLGGNPEQIRSAPKQALQRKLLDALRYLTREALKLNQTQASDGWLTQDTLWLVSKTVCDKLRAHLLSQGVDGVPERNPALFNVMQEHGIVQTTPDDKAIWKATVTSENGWTQSFTFLKVSPALIWEPSERPAPFRGTIQMDANVDPIGDDSPSPSGRSASPSSSSSAPLSPSRPAPAATENDAIGSALSLLDGSLAVEVDATAVDNYEVSRRQERQIAANSKPVPDAADDDHGKVFVEWLRSAIQTRRLVINDARALVHAVDGTAFVVSPGIFQRYMQEHPEIAGTMKQEGVADWVWVQKRFEKLRLHRKQSNGLNIWTCEVNGPRKTRRLHGYLLLEGGTLFTEQPLDNPFLKLLGNRMASRDSEAA